MISFIRNKHNDEIMEGVYITLAELTATGIDGGFLIPTAGLVTEDLHDFIRKHIKFANVAVDYVVIEYTWGDNNQYVSHLYPGDLILKTDKGWIPYQGAQVDQNFHISTMAKKELQSINDRMVSLMKEAVEVRKLPIKEVYANVKQQIRELHPTVQTRSIGYPTGTPGEWLMAYKVLGSLQTAKYQVAE